MRSLASRLVPLPAHWVRRTNDDGVEYFVNELTDEATYQRPQPLADGWRLTKDQATGIVYYWNVRTRETAAYERQVPPPPPPPSNAPPPPPTASPPLMPLHEDSVSASDSVSSGVLSPPSAPNARRVRLTSIKEFELGSSINGRLVVVTNAPPALEAGGARVGDALLSVNDRACPPEPADALDALRKAHAAVGFVDVELFSAPEGKSISFPLRSTISGDL